MSGGAEHSGSAAGRPRYKWELLALLFCAFFFHQGDRAIFGVVLSAIKADLNLADSQLGLVGSVLFFTLAIMMPVAGYLGDVWNRKKIIIGCLLFWSAATMCTGLAGGLIALIAFRSVATAGGESFYAPAAYPLLATYHTRTRAIALSIHQTSLYIGVMVSGFLGGFIAERWGWRSAFFTFGGGGIVLGVVLMWRLLDAPAPAARSDAGPRDSVWRALGVLFRSPTALLLTAGFTAIVFVNNAYVVWAPVFLQERFHLSLTKAGGFAMFYHHLAALVGILAGGWLSDRVAVTRPVFRPQMMGAAMLLAVPVIFLMGRAGTLAGACAAMAGFGLFRGLYEANTHAALFQVIAPRHRASAVGIMTMLAFLVGSLSPWLLGRLRESYAEGLGLGYGFSVLSGAYLLGGLALLVAVFFTFQRDYYREPGA
ncbi:MAG TPA: MFS transporter [Verrucomicrobiota bacterium]|nr:MFS transporter [Verrucomicrobiota bacterium]HQL79946.1 MFS transporter [Verrucomicrobiota bacterium]